MLLIYIPLCFYFIGGLHRHCGLFFQFTFHYASTLSVSARGACITTCTIYIPLCFYFIVGGMKNNPVDNPIYIPLCFYFIADCLADLDKYCTFTFHYASTLSRRRVSRGDCRIFTFHYASTLSAPETSIVSNISEFTFHYASTLSALRTNSS